MTFYGSDHKVLFWNPSAPSSFVFSFFKRVVAHYTGNEYWINYLVAVGIITVITHGVSKSAVENFNVGP